MEPIDRAIVALAARQHGLVAARQLRAAGLDTRGIGRRVGRGWLTPLGGGVFRAGPIAGPCAREMAALLRHGDRSVVSDRSAAARWQLRGERPGEPVDLVVPTGAAPTHGVRLHRRVLARHDHTVRENLRITTPARTIADLSSSVPPNELERLIEEALLRRLTTVRELCAYGRGRPSLRAALDGRHEPRLTRSEAARRLLELVRAAGLPAPATNVRVAGLEVDMVWPAHRLVVEIDGYAFHGSRTAFERDRARDARLLAAGHRVMRITWRQLVGAPEQAVAAVAGALARG